MRTLSVGRILDSGQHYGGHAYNDGMLEAQHRGVAVTIARCGDALNVEEIAIEVLSPCGALLVGGKNDVNEKSIVTRVTIAGTRILFMGDAGWQTEMGLPHRGVDLRADILKVGHHGSAFASSPAFIAAVAPRFALISVRRHNLFGHPSTGALAALESVGADLYRTDRCGATTAIATPALHVLTTFTCNHKSIGLPGPPSIFLDPASRLITHSVSRSMAAFAPSFSTHHLPAAQAEVSTVLVGPEFGLGSLALELWRVRVAVSLRLDGPLRPDWASVHGTDPTSIRPRSRPCCPATGPIYWAC